MKRPSAASLALATALLGLPGGALAACDEQAGLICGSGTPRVSSAAELQISRGANVTPLASGSGLRAGDRVLTGAAESALALGPSCRIAVGPGSLISVTRSGGRTCASVTNQAGAPGLDSASPAGPSAGAIGVSVAAVAAIGAGIGLANSGNGRRPTVSAQ